MKTPREAFNFWRYRYEYTRAPKLNHTSPIDITLELSSACNQSCGYCYHADQEHLPFTKGLMDFKTAQMIIAQADDLSVPSIKFNWKGESTLNPNFYKITSLAREHANGFTFQERLTNSNFKFQNTRDDIFYGLLNQTKVKVSFDSFVPSVMKAQRAGSDPQLIERNITRFYDWPRRETELVIQAVITKLNQHEDIYSEVKKRWPSATLSIRDMVSGRVENETVKVLEVRKRDFENRQSCIQAHSRLVFRYDGTAFPCCVDINESMPLGNIMKKNTLSEIWNSYDAQMIRNSLKNGTAFIREGACKNCSSFESFKGYKAPWKS